MNNPELKEVYVDVKKEPETIVEMIEGTLSGVPLKLVNLIHNITGS